MTASNVDTRTKLKPVNILASFFGLGYIPFAPGTFGSLGALALYLLLPWQFFELYNWPWYLGSLLIFSLVAVYLCGKAEKDLGEDAGSIVIDEVAGFFVAVALLPKSLMIGIYGFVLFRVFDIAKPFPINRSQDLRGGWGVVADDVLAGLFALLILKVLNLAFPGFFAWRP